MHHIFLSWTVDSRLDGQDSGPRGHVTGRLVPGPGCPVRSEFPWNVPDHENRPVQQVPPHTERNAG